MCKGKTVKSKKALEAEELPVENPPQDPPAKKTKKKKVEEPAAPADAPVEETKKKKKTKSKDTEKSAGSQPEKKVKKVKRKRSETGTETEAEEKPVEEKPAEGEPSVPKKKKKKDPTEDVPLLSAEEHFAKHDIQILNGNATPFQRFSDVEECTGKALVQRFSKAGFTQPSPIQSVSWPVALKGQDLIAIAKTGSGKTLGFLVPAFSMILKTLPTDPRQPRVQMGAPPQAMVLAPTRELALQISEECTKFGNPLRVVSVVVFGGVPSGAQIRQLRRGCHIVIATPGRLQDLLDLDNPPVTNLNQVKYAVLDEADQMLDMGFEPHITKLMGLLPEHQTLMFTATWPKAIQKIARRFLREPVHVQVGGDALRANADIEQKFVEVYQGTKEASLVKELSQYVDTTESILVFVNRKADCESVAKTVKRSGLTSTAVHGDLDQSERLRALKLFKDEKVRVVVATDVAARGLDINNVGLVVNYDFPPSGCEIWVHRVGRTGRAGRQGKATTFFNSDGPERKWAPELLELLQNSGAPVPDFLPPLAEVVAPENERMKNKRDFFRKGNNGKGKGKGKGGKGGKGSKGGKGGRGGWW